MSTKMVSNKKKTSTTMQKIEVDRNTINNQNKYTICSSFCYEMHQNATSWNNLNFLNDKSLLSFFSFESHLVYINFETEKNA